MTDSDRPWNPFHRAKPIRSHRTPAILKHIYIFSLPSSSSSYNTFPTNVVTVEACGLPWLRSKRVSASDTLCSHNPWPDRFQPHRPQHISIHELISMKDNQTNVWIKKSYNNVLVNFQLRTIGIIFRRGRGILPLKVFTWTQTPPNATLFGLNWAGHFFLTLVKTEDADLMGWITFLSWLLVDILWIHKWPDVTLCLAVTCNDLFYFLIWLC